ncbi:hypothetical protein CES85_0667 [Ochrobactrum quorumnocens]|uniref:Uncharacterized protein n=1 Tax=Ochrobactrum quorumnocens TaxID=271865 RepID=A0A248UKC1_9HYPH|nr:hypothetical protein CES85_0667 [[Ochrobactrum] quorumnocens]
MNSLLLSAFRSDFSDLRASTLCFNAHLIRKPFHTFRDALQNGSVKIETS